MKKVVLETKLKSEIASDDQTKVALTSDIWTSSTNEAYLSVTSSIYQQTGNCIRQFWLQLNSRSSTQLTIWLSS